MARSLRLLLLLAAAFSCLTLTGCGADAEPGTAEPTVSAATTETSSPDASAAPSASPEQTPDRDPDAVTIKLTVRGNSLKPDPRVVKVKRDKPVVFLIDSDRPGGLHVHSSPEQSPEFKTGQSTITITLDQPGVVEVEEHAADALVVQLEVR